MWFLEFQHFSSRHVARCMKISTYRIFWLHLRQLTQDLGNATGFTYGGHTLLFFTLSVLVSYGFLVELKNDFNFILFTSSLLFQSIIYSQCNCAQNAANQVRSYIELPVANYPLGFWFHVVQRMSVILEEKNPPSSGYACCLFLLVFCVVYF